ncbi:MAG: DUF5715 family protein [Acidobacteriota bacterium]|nr:DUF5715 family protein [Acidobacteriota bacterium]
MNPKVRQILLLIIVCSLIGLGVLALFRYQEVRRLRLSEYLANHVNLKIPDAELWAQAVEKVKEDRGASGGAAIEIPTQLRHYEDRHWFLATQVAEVEKFNLQSCQDFVDLAAMLERGELVSLPPVTETYVLFGVGARADDGAFSRFVDDHNIALYNETELRAAYARLDSARLKLETEISNLKSQLTALKKAERSKQRELQKELSARQQELQANADEKALLDRAYGQPGSRQTLLQDYESLQALAKNFAGRAYNLEDSNDRYALKVSMLSSLRPQALKILEEVAKAYHDKFARPLPVSSLVRPEQYQHALRKVNRNAVLIDTPPHSTGLAFDIDYRYMSGDEQNFLMTELARMKDEGRIEVIRERRANYHVFAFMDGKRPGDELINASLASIEECGAPVQEAHHATKEPPKPAIKSRTVERKKTHSKAKSNSRSKKRRIR